MKKTSLPLIIICWLVSFIASGQENRLIQRQLNSAQIYHNIEKLGFLGSALYVAAHPDDENTRLISYLANDRMARTAYLSLTRGDGGQNLIGSQLREQLGIIRTQELLEARNIDGGEQFFSRANDFGYSKHPDETLKIWDEKKVLDDIVYIIRTFKPDVIINRFNHRTPGTTHGHHTSSAMLSVTAYDLAADKKVTTIKNTTLDSWQPSRLFFNTSWWFYGSRDAFAKADKTNLLELDTGSYYNHLGYSNNEIAALSRSQHKSQGFGSRGSRGKQTEYLEYLKGSFPSDKSDLFSGINTTWSRVTNSKKVIKALDKLKENYDFKKPEASLENLIVLHDEISKLENSYWKNIKLKEVEDLLLSINGIYLEASTKAQQATAGDELDLAIECTNRSSNTVDFKIKKASNLNLEKTDTSLKNDTAILNVVIIIPEDSNSNPYYLNEPATLGMYSYKDASLTGMPENNPSLQIPLELTVGGITIKRNLSVIHKRTDPIRGEINEPLHIIPAVSISIIDPVYIYGAEKTKEIKVRVKNFKKLENATLKLNIPANWEVVPQYIGINKLLKNNDQEFIFNLTAPETAAVGTITATLTAGSKNYDQEVLNINYNHIPNQVLIRNNGAQIVKPNLKNTAKKVAYINGAGDNVAAAIRAIGSQVDTFEPMDLPTDLSNYDAVMIGIRAYNVNKNAMRLLQSRLDNYVKNGGTLITQYNTSRGVSKNAIGPLDITLSRKRVTDEHAAITFLNPSHPLLNTPNKITQADFENWVQERGLYFPSEWDDSFVPLLGMNDKDEDLTRGSLLVANYGKGTVIYTGLSLFRELPAGVPGAYRLLANMLSASK